MIEEQKTYTHYFQSNHESKLNSQIDYFKMKKEENERMLNFAKENRDKTSKQLNIILTAIEKESLLQEV